MYQDYKNVELVKPSGLDLKDRLVGVQRVTKVTKGGRAFGFSAIVVVGDENGVVGHGLGKSKEVASAIAKAMEDAKKNLVRIPLKHDVLSKNQGSSNPHNVVKATFDALLQLRSAETVAKQRGISLDKVFKG